jgi:hypothetical protein
MGHLRSKRRKEFLAEEIPILLEEIKPTRERMMKVCIDFKVPSEIYTHASAVIEAIDAFAKLLGEEGYFHLKSATAEQQRPLMPRE